ncbi:hypothetical protein Daus18300_003937 [Diaporthe australafricana]|uniref:Uncharacterized protein n=1 Tax=Diaporthe australafricana TaxID=127596 RepID=A0ABR3XD22_9PEZI
MEEGTAMELPSSPTAAEPSTLSEGNQQSVSFDQPREHRSLRSIKTEQPETVDGTIGDQRPRIAYNMEADRGCEAENIHLSQHSNNTIDFFAGIQDSDVNCVPSDSDSDSDDNLRDSNDGHNTPKQGSGNVAIENHDDNEIGNDGLVHANTAEGDGETSVNAQDLMLRAERDQDHEDVYDEKRSIFVDFDEDIDVEDDEALLTHERDNEMEEDVGIGFGSINAFVYPRTDEIIAKHLSTPGRQTFTDLQDLLSSKNAPGRGLYKVEKVLEHEEARAAELEEHPRYIEAELQEVKERKNMTEDVVASARADFSSACSKVGINDKLWEEYEAFCESLEPKFGGRGGWSVTCFENHNGSYVLLDSDLDLFVESAEMPLQNCNFRCEATTVKNGGRTEYVVDFWPLHSLEPRTETATTWEEQYIPVDGQQDEVGVAAKTESAESQDVKMEDAD